MIILDYFYKLQVSYKQLISLRFLNFLFATIEVNFVGHHGPGYHGTSPKIHKLLQFSQMQI